MSAKVDEDELRRLVQDEAMKLPDMNLVVSGMAGRFPKSDSVAEFEENLYTGLDMVNDEDNSRFTCGLWGLPPRAGRLKNLNRFDCEFFGYHPTEASMTDFQLRILYEVVYESILDAGVNPSSLRGTNTGVFFGLHCAEFENAMADDPSFKSNGYFAQYAVKVAQFFDLRGITITFDAACASGFVGLSNAVEAMSEGLIDRAIVCSCNIPIHPTGSFIFLQMQMLSPTGYSRFLDLRADGYVKSEACVSVLLQRKPEALRNYASIMSIMTSVDGYKREGITFPSDTGQECLIRATKDLAGLSTNHIEYLEAHGTGTPAGDPQEARAIANVYFPVEEKDQRLKIHESDVDVDGEEDEKGDEHVNKETERRVIGPLLVGSVKTNMGHSEAASGLCALAKAILMLENELIYKSLNFEQPNSNIEALMDGRLKFIEETTKLTGKIIPLSCYGFGGANVHAIVRANDRPAIDGDLNNKNEADREPKDEMSTDSTRIILIFGRTEEAINEMFDDILDKKQSRATRYCLTDDFLILLDSLNAHPIDRLMNYRGHLIVDRERKSELSRGIKRCDLNTKDNISSNSDCADIGRREHLQSCKERPCHLILPGLGSQWPQMAAGLRDFKPFWDTIERLSHILEPLLLNDQINLDEMLLTADESSLSSMVAKLVAITGYEIALINIIRDQLKVKNLTSIVGHSLGEISAAYACGLIDERETILIAYRLGKTLDDNLDVIKGKMLAVVGWNLEQMEDKLRNIRQQNPTSTLQVCCLNSENSLTISGRAKDVNALTEELVKQEELYLKIVEDSVALHNHQIMGENIRNKLKAAVEIVLFSGRTDLERPNDWISSVDHSIASKNKQANADYFADSLCYPVDFAAAINTIERDSICIELGPSAPFESMFCQMQNQQNLKQMLYHTKLMRRSVKKDEQKLYLLKQIGELYQLGARMNLVHFYHGFDKPNKPLRRQTPSLSSIFRWNHEHELFVPRYPIQFGKSAAKCEMPVDVVQERDKYLTDHAIEGRVLFPATGYLFLIWRVFSFTQRKIYDAAFNDVEKELVPIEFHNVRLFRAVILGGRSAQIYMHLEEATGRFEIKNGGSVVVEGYVRTPTENPTGLLYENVKQRVKSENLEMTLTMDDVYKQFRVCGYDYGEKFRNIESASADGRYCRVKYNGHFVALTDSVLQCIFLAVAQYTPAGGLVLPTSFEYVRFQPDAILKKIREAKMIFDMADGALNMKEKREAMTKMMQRESGMKFADQTPEQQDQDQQKQVEQQVDEEKPECIFETFCDPVTGVIITDGVEMRGIKATPAPRRTDNNEALLESYQFVCDSEEPLQDENLTQFDHTIGVYTKVCDSMSIELLKKFQSNQRIIKTKYTGHNDGFEMISNSQLEKEKIEQYMKLHNLIRPTNNEQEKLDDQEDYDIKKNGDKVLLSVLCELLSFRDNDYAKEPQQLRELVQKNRFNLMHDFIQSSFICERLMRPLIEMIVENCCTKKRKLKLMEINSDDGIMKEPLTNFIQLIEPGLTVDYALAHPDPNRLTTNKVLNPNGSTSNSASTRKYTIRDNDVQSLCNEQNIKDLDAIIYKDISCYSLPKQIVEENGLAPVLTSLNGAIKLGGYVLLVMRKELTLAERILLALSEPELVGLSERNLTEMQTNSQSTIKQINHINTILRMRYKQMLNEAEKNKMICVAKKSDKNGCSVLVFRSTCKLDLSVSASEQNLASDARVETERIIIRVSHQNNIENWLNRLKDCFRQDEKESKDGEKQEVNDSGQQPEDEKKQKRKIVWLCSVATKQQPINGLIGMMQALRKEVGSDSLRCYYDEFSFKDSLEPINESQIECCAKFQESIQRDQIWNCIDSGGNFGSFRHFTINDYMSYRECRCNSALSDSEIVERDDNKSRMAAAYVNNEVRGDLSSFTWHEAPFTYLTKEEREDVVQIAYSALNFRDIMLATGRLPLDAVPMRLAMSDCLLGLEFSGVTKDGKRVVGMVPSRGIATHSLCTGKCSLKLEVPDWISLKDAATIPVVYATTIMALIYRGKMERGESILIHAGSGGVGQAAIRLAAHWGLTIYTTVGTDEKRQFLLDEFGYCLEDDRIFSSRDCEFEWKILEATKGRGVDLVLNSLADDKLQASLRCLADGGRFLEIGKYDMSMNTRLELFQLDDNKTFHGILLDKLFDIDDPIRPAFQQQMQSIGETLREGIWEGYIKPIKSTVFESGQIEEAVRFMATGKHIGKVLIEINSQLDVNNQPIISQRVVPKCIPRFQLSPEKSYIVTGGLGGFGLELVKWLVSQGARHILITSRQGIKTGYQKVTLERQQAVNDARFLIVTAQMADTTTAEGVEQLLEMALEMSPINEVGGIFHLAMVLKDTMLENMEATDFELVCKPKVDTCVHLDEISRKMSLKLDYFVCFSSVTSGKGNAGQSNYAYANSCIERICEKRRQKWQEHGLAIQWGAIGDVGVAYENLGGNDVVIGGTIPQRMPSCLATLSRLLCGPFTICLSVVPVSRRSQDSSGEKGDLVGAIMHVLGIKDPSKVSEKATLGELGLDSLMAVEIRQYIEREFDVTLNIQEIRSLTVEKIREIQEKGPKKVSQEKQQQELKTGEQLTSDTDADISSSAVMNGEQINDLKGISNEQPQIHGYGSAAKAAIQNKLANEEIEAMLDKNMVTSFLPQLKLPKPDYRRLNYVFTNKTDQHTNGHSANQPRTKNKLADNDSRPIFFVPPIHGEFNQLEMICTDIKRPCIGLNWNRKLGKAKSVTEACEIYLALLSNTDWANEFYLPNDGIVEEEKEEERVVDLVGYSYGATIAFEMMLMLHSNGDEKGKFPKLKAGKLILLDGSPKQIELGSQYLSNLTRKKPLEPKEQLDELLMVYLLAHTRRRTVDYIGFQKQLSKEPIEKKIKLASERLFQYVDSRYNSVLEIADAMEAFCRRYELVSNYKTSSNLPNDCTLVRAEKVYLTEAGSSDGQERKYMTEKDLGLSLVVDGKVDLFVMNGNHETFLDENRRQISKIITKHCSKN